MIVFFKKWCIIVTYVFLTIQISTNLLPNPVQTQRTHLAEASLNIFDILNTGD